MLTYYLAIWKSTPFSIFCCSQNLPLNVFKHIKILLFSYLLFLLRHPNFLLPSLFKNLLSFSHNLWLIQFHLSHLFADFFHFPTVYEPNLCFPFVSIFIFHRCPGCRPFSLLPKYVSTYLGLLTKIRLFPSSSSKSHV